MGKEFRDFILRGNVVALAIAVVIGVAFGAVITSFVEDLLTPLIAAIGGQPDFSELTFTINGSQFFYGQFVNAVVSFLIIAAVVFFLVIVPLNRLMHRYEDEDEATPPEYATITATSAAELQRDVNVRAEDGWRVVSTSDGPGSREVTAVLIKE
jgi:large conductance mechanosensitive channel